MNGQTIRTITIRGTSEGLDKLTADLNKLAAAEQNVAVVSEQSAKRVLSLEDAWKRQTLKLDEAARAQANIARETRVADAALREGLATQQQHAQRIEQINQRYAIATQSTQKFTQQSGLARHELINLGRQAQDVAVSLAGGQGFGTVLLQQGSQIADVFVASGKSVGSFFTQAIGWGARFATSAAGVATGVAGIAAGALYAASSWADGQREIDRALLGIGKRAGATRGEINQMAEANAAGAKLSVSEWAAGAAEFAKTGTIYKENFKGLNDLVKGFAATTGSSAEEAQKELAKIFGGEVLGAADKLNSIYGTISGATREYARELEVAGKRQEAIAVLVRDITPAIKQAEQVTGFWAASWDAVANKAKNAGSSIGQALSAMTGVGDTPEAQLQRLQVQLANAEKALAQLREEAAQLGPDLVPGLKIAEQGTESLRERVAALRQQLGKVDETSALLKMGRDADDAVKKLLPQIDQLRQVEDLQRKIREGQTPGSGAGLGAFSQQALNAAEVLKDKIKQTADETARANANGLQLKETYGTTTIEAARTLAALRDQANVAGAVGVQEQMRAQRQATINQLVREGKDLHDAIKIANAEMAVTQARINAEHERAMILLQGQLNVAQQVTGAKQIQAQYEANIVSLMLKGFDLAQATAQAEMQRSIALAQVNAQAERQLKNLQNEYELIRASSEEEKGRIRARQEYNKLIEEGVTSERAGAIASQMQANARATQDAADATKSWSVQMDEANDAINSVSGALDRNAQSANAAAAATARYFAEYEKAAFLPFSTLDMMGGFGGLYQSPQGGYSQFDPGGYTSTRYASHQVPRLTPLAPDFSSQLGLDKITDPLTRLALGLGPLTEATKENTEATSAMTDVLSPFYSSDPRRTHLGFRAFAGGGIMTQYGELPLKHYQGGGMATSPQVAMFGEGSTPEAYVPVPSGRIPVEIKAPANNNQRPITVNINVLGNADDRTVGALKTTAFQQAQTMRRAMS